MTTSDSVGCIVFPPPLHELQPLLQPQPEYPPPHPQLEPPLLQPQVEQPPLQPHCEAQWQLATGES